VVWHCHEEVLLLPVGLDIFCALHPKASTELHSTIQKSHFHYYGTAEEARAQQGLYSHWGKTN
jgi:hypothetical protein